MRKTLKTDGFLSCKRRKPFQRDMEQTIQLKLHYIVSSRRWVDNKDYQIRGVSHVLNSSF